ncbi:hypothetical protein V1J52_07230 [Streptomyces sp. TRM 70351]|uniref:hypothetical protein n=1 Tax=Streptomyces sp. TRM 70351 TaxID=3116552 RepID=UPI002E7BF174|nr:hypothetical protein [Streptomyces sp. TRM 70351]MEE1927988.1 hypothetical protein [Streptomyces sp. TRM 70351]
MTTQLTPYDRRMLSRMNDARAREWCATRPRRRATVLVHVALTVALGAAHLALFRSSSLWWVAAIAGLTLLWCLCTGMLNLATRGLLELRSRALDERQLAERGRVHTAAHRTQLLLIALALPGLYVWHQAGGVPVWGVGSTLAALLATHWLLPLWTAAFTADDEPAESEA